MDSATDADELAGATDATDETADETADELVVPRPSEPAAASLTRSERRRADRRPWETAAPWFIAVGALVLRLLTAANGPTDWDSAQYAAAVGHFDVTHGEPQPPGYWLYVMAGRLIHQISGLGTIHSLVLVSAVASAAAAGLTTVAGRDLGGPWVGLAAGLVVTTCPFAWFSGSIVATYSFDMVGCSLLIILAWRARPGSWHGVAAVVALGVLAGFRQSMVQSFAVLALIPVVASTRRWGRLGLTIVAGAAAVGVWMIPMSLSQAGGFGAWARATRTEATGAAHATSVLDHAAAGATNLGTFAATTTVALAPLVLLALLAGAALGLRRLGSRGQHGDRPFDVESGPDTDSSELDGPVEWSRPWYQGRLAVLTAAIVTPMLLVALVQFAKGGYLLAYLPAAVIALLLPVGALNWKALVGDRSPQVWLVITSVAVVVIVALGAQRFLAGEGVLPERLVTSSSGLWFDQQRYQAPYTETRHAITDADAYDTALRALGPSIHAESDVVVFDTVDGGQNIYRNAGWALPGDRIALIEPGGVLYNQLDGALYYASGAAVDVGPAGSAILVASPSLPGLAALTAQGDAVAVATNPPIGGFRVWRIRPGSSILGVRVVVTGGIRPLGTGI